MPRYLVQRSFPGGLALAPSEAGAEACREVVERNAALGVTWVHSYVSEDKETTFCIYDSPSPEAIREAAERNRMSADRIVEVSVLDPYFYR